MLSCAYSNRIASLEECKEPIPVVLHISTFRDGLQKRHAICFKTLETCHILNQVLGAKLPVDVLTRWKR